jgi:hypothetical protein
MTDDRASVTLFRPPHRRHPHDLGEADEDTSTRPANQKYASSKERRKGFEPSTPSLGSWPRAPERHHAVWALPLATVETAPAAPRTLPPVRSG